MRAPLLFLYNILPHLSSKWIKRYVSQTKIRLDTSHFIHFYDKYFRTEGVLNSKYKFLWVVRWCVGEVPRDRFNASEKKTSLELATWLFLSNAPLTVRYVYDGASYCTYTAVLPPFRFIGLNSKISPTKMVSGGIFFVVCKST